MKQKIILTGAHGFLGSFLTKSLGEQFSFLTVSQENSQNFPHFLEESQTILHLAGLSSPSEAEKSPQLAYDANVSLTAAWADLFYKKHPSGHFIFASTAQVYAPQSAGVLTESSPVSPRGVYSKSKLIAEEALQIICPPSGKLTILRLFNHTHYTQDPHFFLPSVYQQLVAGKNSPVILKVGNLEVRRDFSAVRDFVSAVRALLTHQDQVQHQQIFNLCSEQTFHLKELCIALADRLGKQIQFEIDPDKIRSKNNDPEVIKGNSQLFQKKFRWKTSSSDLSSFLDGFLEK